MTDIVTHYEEAMAWTLNKICIRRLWEFIFQSFLLTCKGNWVLWTQNNHLNTDSNQAFNPTWGRNYFVCPWKQIQNTDLIDDNFGASVPNTTATYDQVVNKREKQQEEEKEEEEERKKTWIWKTSIKWRKKLTEQILTCT